MVVAANSSAQANSPPASNKVAVLLAGYGGVKNYSQFIQYNKRATHYIAAKFAPIPRWTYSIAARLLSLRDWFKWGYKHHDFTSPQNEIFEKQRLEIEKQLQEYWGENLQVFKGFYFCEPFLSDVLSQIKEAGYRQLIIYPLLVVNSVFTSKIAVQQVNQTLDSLTDKSEKWLDGLRYLPSFHNQSEYINLIAQQVEEKIENELLEILSPSQIGIILETHGGPEKSLGLDTGVKDGQELFELVQGKLIHKYPLISVGWINHDTPFVPWTKPNLEEAARNLIELGAKAIIFKPIGWATENYETILEVEEAIISLKQKYSDITHIQTKCVNDSPEFVKMAAAWVNPHLEALLTSSGV
jgi:ferrochelatase